jgi:hypothetical protein
VLPSFKPVFRAAEEFQKAMAATLRFDEKELAYLLDADEDSSGVRALAAQRDEAPPPKRGFEEFKGEEA